MEPDAFEARNREVIAAMGRDTDLRDLSDRWFAAASRHEYSYHFTWLGLPVIQFPQDVVALQEIVWRVRPDVVVETGVARGGSLVLYASLLELLGGDGFVVGIDIDIRPHNRAALEAHPLFRRIRLVEGSSVAPGIVAHVRAMIADRRRVLVVLDSNHTHDHVRRELDLYAPLVTKGSYLVVLDTVIETMPADLCKDRPWGRGDNPRTAVRDFLASTDRFEVDVETETKLLVTVAPEGFLRCVRD